MPDEIGKVEIYTTIVHAQKYKIAFLIFINYRHTPLLFM